MENEQIIFRTKNDQNMIIEREDCYLLRAPKGEAVFDKQKNVLKTVIKTIQTYGNAAYSTQKGSGFRFNTSKNNHSCSLGQVVFCAYNKLSLCDLAHGNLRYLDGNPYNLRKANLIFPQRQTVKYISIFGKQYILINVETADHKRHCAITNGDPNLFSLLSDMGWQFQKSERCLKANIGVSSFDLHYVVWIFFNYKDITKENFAEKAADFRKNINDNSLSIDHKKSSITRDCWDNRIENLQLISQTLNNSKKDSTSRLHGDLFYIPTANGEIYGHYDWANGYIDFCENEGNATVASIDQLRRFYKTGEFQETDNHYKVPLDSPKGAEIQQADFRETKLYSEVLIYD